MESQAQKIDKVDPQKKTSSTFKRQFISISCTRSVVKLMQKAIDKLDSWVADAARQVAINLLESCVADHNKNIIRGALKNALNE